MLPVVSVNFSDIDDEGRVFIPHGTVDTGVTVGSLVLLTSAASARPRYATLYDVNDEFYCFRVQE